MYSLDINFLNDRPEHKPDAAARSRPKAAVSPDSRRALLLGGLAALLLPALAAGSLLFLQNRNADLERQQADLDARLGNLQAKQKEIANIRTQTSQIRDETTALAGIFNQIKPWSAMMQDIRDRIPPGVQIRAVKQLPAPKPGSQPQPSPAAGAAPATPAVPVQGPIAITGLANSFNDVNDFMLVLQRSNFLKARETTLVSSQLEATARQLGEIRLRNAPGGGSQNAPEIPRQVEFEIQTALSDVPASELLRELDRKGAAGLVTRIETLQQKGVIQPQ